MRRGLPTLYRLRRARAGGGLRIVEQPSTSSTTALGDLGRLDARLDQRRTENDDHAQIRHPAAPAAVQKTGAVHVLYHNISISPDALKVKVGSTITWTNLDAIEHNVTSEGGPQKFASRTFGEGRSFSITAVKPGVIHYECTIHPASMNGTIEVVK